MDYNPANSDYVSFPKFTPTLNKEKITTNKRKLFQLERGIHKQKESVLHTLNLILENRRLIER